MMVALPIRRPGGLPAAAAGPSLCMDAPCRVQLRRRGAALDDCGAGRAVARRCFGAWRSGNWAGWPGMYCGVPGKAPVLRPSCALLTPWWQQGAARLKHSLHRDQERSMITLYGFGAGFGLPEISPFVTKTEVQLKMAGLAYRKERAMPPASPKGQLPYIEDDSERIADSTFIRAHIERKYGFDFDAGLDLQQRAQAWAFERMIEHHVYWALVGRPLDRCGEFCQGADAFLRRRAGACPGEAARGCSIPRRRELSPERPRPPCPRRRCRSGCSFAVCAVGPARRQAISDGRPPLRRRCHRLRCACRRADTVFCLCIA